MAFDQGEFNFDADGPEDGYRKWRERLDEEKRAFESRWGVVLGKRVRAVLTDHAKPLSGVLEWFREPGDPATTAPRFRLRGVEFGPGEIESIVRED